jgi:hypothetical protein
MEIWKTLKYKGITYNDYSLSSGGKIMRNKTGRIYKYHLDHNGYPQVTVYVGYNKETKRLYNKTIVIHKAVGECFIPNPYNKKFINHKDGNKLNSDYTNLEWCTHKENMIHASKTGLLNSNASRGVNNGLSKLSVDDVKFIRNHYKQDYTCKQLMHKYNISKSTVQNVYKRKTYNNI